MHYRLLLLLIGFCFLAKNLELNEHERKENLRKEVHECVIDAKQAGPHAITTVEQVIPFFNFIEFRYSFSASVLTENIEYSFSTDYSPPKIYLHNSVFLI